MIAELCTPEDYEMHFSEGKYSFTNNNKKFTTTSSALKRHKLYALYDESRLHYIGVTSRRISTRLRDGLKAKGKNGYHGYKWKEKGKLNLSVWTLSNYDEESATIIFEAIEAEVAFLYRQKYNRWPESQNEIHFNNDAPLQNNLAQQILAHIERDF